jgi:hypothetical protein
LWIFPKFLRTRKLFWIVVAILSGSSFPRAPDYKRV